MSFRFGLLSHSLLLVFLVSCYTTQDKSRRDKTITTRKVPLPINGKRTEVKKETKKDPEPVVHKYSPPKQSGLRAGYADDNRQFNYFLGFLNKFKNKNVYPMDVTERIILELQDAAGKSLPNARVEIRSGNKRLTVGKTYADGSFSFYPSLYKKVGQSFQARITYNQKKRLYKIKRKGKRRINLKWEAPRALGQTVPVDIVFIFDTTGSMGEEIARLKQALEVIHMNIAAAAPRAEIRFGMVLYRDRGEDYVTRTIPLTSDRKHFQRELNRVQVAGGGDRPEDLQSALKTALKTMEWNRRGIRMGYVITDAPPHMDYGQQYTYLHAAREARRLGVKLFTVGTGGLEVRGEYVLRQIAHFTQAKYIFLTYGEKGESSGGRQGSVSHHTGANFTTDKLETVIIRFAKEEMSRVMKLPVSGTEEHFTANKVSWEKRQETLRKLFARAAKQLVNYAALQGVEKNTTAVLPILTPAVHKSDAEYFTQQMYFAVARGKIFNIVERDQLSSILREISLQTSGLTETDNAARVGRLSGARQVILGKLIRKKDRYELFFKLVRVETAEVLSVTRALIDPGLGL